MALNMLRALQQDGHEQLAVTSTWTDGEFSRRLQVMQISEVKLPFGTLSKKLALRPIWWTANSLAKIPTLWRGWVKTLREFKPDVVVLTNSRQALLLYPWLGYCPTFLIEHSDKQESRTNRWVYRRLSRKLAAFVPASDFMAVHLNRLGVPPGKMTVIKNGVLSEKAVLVDTAADINHRRAEVSRPRIGIAGQVSPHKGHDCLIEAARLLSDGGKDFVVRVFGTGTPMYVEQLKQKIAAAHLGRKWEWMGYETNLAKIYGAMDICAMPSCFDEPFGMVALEASGYGLPVVASRRGGLPEIIEEGVTGFLFDSSKPDELASKIAWLSEHPEIAKKMGAAGRKRALRLFTQEKMAAEFESLFRSYLNL